MAQKITLSVPDLLYERIKQWRDSFNLSKMFQEVMTEAIQKKEEFQKRFHQDFDLQDIVKRLKIEKYQAEKNFYESGKNQGIQWAKSAHYEDLIYVLQIEDPYQLDSDDRLESYFRTLFTSDSRHSALIHFSSDNKKLFLDGWFKGVCHFWKQIEESL